MKWFSRDFIAKVPFLFGLGRKQFGKPKGNKYEARKHACSYVCVTTMEEETKKNGIHKKADTHASRHAHRNIKEWRKNTVETSIELIGNLSAKEFHLAWLTLNKTLKDPVKPVRPDRDANK